MQAAIDVCKDGIHNVYDNSYRINQETGVMSDMQGIEWPSEDARRSYQVPFSSNRSSMEGQMKK